MIRLAVIIGTAVGVTYYMLMSTVWDVALNQTHAYQQQYEQALTLVEQMEQTSVPAL